MKNQNLTKHFSIHGLINLEINNEKGTLFGATSLNNPLSYFEVDHIGKDVDICMNIGDFKPKFKENYLVDHKYHINENYLYVEDYGNSANWKLEIEGLEEPPVTINFNGNIKGIYKYIFADALAFEVVLKPVIELLLGFKGYFLAHAGSISMNNNSELFFGTEGSLKTTIILEGLKRGYRILGDDKVILDLDRKKAFSFPVYPQLFEYTVGVGREELSFTDKFKFLYQSFKYKKSAEFWENQSFIFNKGFLLKRFKNKAEPTIKQDENHQILTSIINNNKGEMYNSSLSSIVGKNNFPNYLLAYSYIFNSGNIAEYWVNLENNLYESFKNITLYEINIPEKYNETTLKKIFTMIEDFQ
ncbi:hypothetical protein [Methanobacterium petrolearium]|uniref:hypothetical protein n=1 Tax=Methanobacterium petrolearium TaxID=710190 RepID=UPI001AE8DC2A|nr:hypothetical protein [Methanobacterium petrolearium]MBP1945471.1 hypothetical protein [Methanobacterium petrolearium]BDZ71677.1 hypothetical protein GCM10025861_21940 [Methanobacterium petrolearium]